MRGTSMTLRPCEREGMEEVGRERMASTSGVKAVRASFTHRPEGRGASVSKAGIGITPGRRRRREAHL